MATYVAGVSTDDHADEPEQLAVGDVSTLSEDQLILAIQRSEEARKVGRERTGRLLAELYRRGHLSWPAISRTTGIRQTTAYELAKQYLPPDEGVEQHQQ